MQVSEHAMTGFLSLTSAQDGSWMTHTLAHRRAHSRQDMTRIRKKRAWLSRKPHGNIRATVRAYAYGDDFEHLFENAPQPMWLYDLASLRFLDVNRAALQQYGYERERFLRMDMEQLHLPEDVEPLYKHLKKQRAAYSAGIDSASTAWRLVTRDGALVWVDLHSQVARYEGHDAALIVAVDATARKQAEDRLAVQQAYFRQLFNRSSDAILLLDHNDVAVDANEQFTKLFGYPLEQVTGAHAESLIAPKTPDAKTPTALSQAGERSVVEQQVQRRRSDGKLLDVTLSGYPIDLGSERVGTYLIYHDLAEKKRLVNRVRYHTTHDAETGLMNRRAIQREVRQHLHAVRHSKDMPAVLHVSLNGLAMLARSGKPVAGKALLESIVTALKSVSGADSIAHIYADEFCILLPGANRHKAHDIAKAAVTNVVDLSARGNHRISINVGGFLPHDKKTPPRTVLAMAEMACEIARKKGANKVHIADRDDPESAHHHYEARCLSTIHEALDNDRFVLYAQRIAPLSDQNKRPECEILVRMRDGDNGIVAPDDFIPVAERFRLMNEIDRALIKKLFVQLDDFIATHGELAVGLNVNLSGETIGDDELTDFIQALFNYYRVPPAQICFEITETAAIQNIAQARIFIREMRAIGCKIALDDFGSGMSSFRYLRELNVDYLKIDGLFIKDMLTNAADRAMTEAINRMAHALDIVTIAEWVESLDMLEHLREWGTGYVQGFAIQRPEPLTHEFLIA